MASKQNISILGSLKKFFAILSLDKTDISAIYVLAILAGLVQLSLPLGIQTIISFVMAGSVSTSIVVLITLVVIGTFIYGLLQIRQMQVIERVEQKLFMRYSLEFTDRLPKLNMEKMDGYHLPEVVNRFFETILLQKGLEKLLLDLPTALIQVLLGIILLALYHPVFIGFGAVLLITIIGIIRFTSLEGLSAAMKVSDYKYGMMNWLQEIARVIKPFKYAKETQLHIEKSDKILGGYLDSRTSYFKVLLTQYWSLVVFKILITAGMLIMGVVLLVDQQINIGQFIATDIVILTIIGSVEKFVVNLDKVYDALVSIEKLNKITEAAVEESGTLLLSDKQAGVQIELKQVSYAYPNQVAVLNNISCKINQGSIVHLQGGSGEGKGTLLRLLSGAYKEFTGNILVDEIPIGNYHLQSLRSRTGILLQYNEVFDGTFLENITMCNKSVAMEEITTLAKLTGLDEYMASLTQGYDTYINAQGKKLPNKVRVNIALIRALIGNHRLLLLENPFSHLTETQAVNLLQYIKKQKKATVIISSPDKTLPIPPDLRLVLQNRRLFIEG